MTLFEQTFKKNLEYLRESVNANNLNDLIAKWKALGVSADVYPCRDNNILLSRLVVDKDKRNQGLGTEFMQDLNKFADSHNLTVRLSPDISFGGTSVTRLKSFYKKQGYVNNTGRNKDFTSSDSMYRRPITAR